MKVDNSKKIMAFILKKIDQRQDVILIDELGKNMSNKSHSFERNT
jgi:nucleoside-triphosphatase THEP1